MTKTNETVIKDFLENKMHLSEKRIIQECEGLKKHSDIENEFATYIENGWKNMSCKFIEVEGYTAKELSEKYSLSILGAYNYLIYLREEPMEAINFLKKGLPRE